MSAIFHHQMLTYNLKKEKKALHGLNEKNCSKIHPDLILKGL